jgi:hypothetical protein
VASIVRLREDQRTGFINFCNRAARNPSVSAQKHSPVPFSHSLGHKLPETAATVSSSGVSFDQLQTSNQKSPMAAVSCKRCVCPDMLDLTRAMLLFASPTWLDKLGKRNGDQIERAGAFFDPGKNECPFKARNDRQGIHFGIFSTETGVCEVHAP